MHGDYLITTKTHTRLFDRLSTASTATAATAAIISIIFHTSLPLSQKQSFPTISLTCNLYDVVFKGWRYLTSASINPLTNVFLPV